MKKTRETCLINIQHDLELDPRLGVKGNRYKGERVLGKLTSFEHELKFR